MKNIATHPAFEADFKAFLDGELPVLRRFQVRRHLQYCPQCREEIQIMQTIETELKTEESALLDEGLRARILESAPVGESQIAPRLPYKMPRRLRRQLALGAVAGVLAASVAAPNFFNARENARRSSVQSNLKPVEVGESAATEDVNGDSKAPSAAGASTSSAVASSASQSNAPVAGAIRMDGAARETDAPRAVNQRSVANWDFSDGHVKTQLRSESARISGGGGNGGIVTFSPFHRQSLNQAGAADKRISGDSSQDLNGDGNGIFPENRAVHKEGSLTVSLENAEKGGDAVEQIVKNVGGFVASNSLSTGAGEVRSATLDCRVPVEKFDFVTQKVGALGTVRAKTINGEDITARIAAASARKSTLSREFSVASAQLRQKEKVAKKRDAQSLYYARLEVRQLRVQAAQSRAALETLRRFSSLASLYVTVQDKAGDKAAPVAGTNSELTQTARAAWRSLLVSARLPFQLLVWILVYAPLWVPALIIWKKWGRKWVNAA